jgi:predicted DNA-binding transcriptional regulator YafY
MPRAPRHFRLALTPDEAEAMVAALRLAHGSLAPHLHASAQGALGKLLSAVTGKAPDPAVRTDPGDAPPADSADPARLEALQQATAQRHKTRLAYRDPLNQQLTGHTVRPLGCHLWGDVWMLSAWCEEHGQFHTFRVDHVDQLETLDEVFSDEPGRTLDDLFRQLEAEMAERDSAIDA